MAAAATSLLESMERNSHFAAGAEIAEKKLDLQGAEGTSNFPVTDNHLEVTLPNSDTQSPTSQTQASSVWNGIHQHSANSRDRLQESQTRTATAVPSVYDLLHACSPSVRPPEQKMPTVRATTISNSPETFVYGYLSKTVISGPTGASSSRVNSSKVFPEDKPDEFARPKSRNNRQQNNKNLGEQARGGAASTTKKPLLLSRIGGVSYSDSAAYSPSRDASKFPYRVFKIQAKFINEANHTFNGLHMVPLTPEHLKRMTQVELAQFPWAFGTVVLSASGDLAVRPCELPGRLRAVNEVDSLWNASKVILPLGNLTNTAWSPSVDMIGKQVRFQIAITTNTAVALAINVSPGSLLTTSNYVPGTSILLPSLKLSAPSGDLVDTHFSDHHAVSFLPTESIEHAILHTNARPAALAAKERYDSDLSAWQSNLDKDANYNSPTPLPSDYAQKVLIITPDRLLDQYRLRLALGPFYHVQVISKREISRMLASAGSDLVWHQLSLDEIVKCAMSVSPAKENDTPMTFSLAKDEKVTVLLASTETSELKDIKKFLLNSFNTRHPGGHVSVGDVVATIPRPPGSCMSNISATLPGALGSKLGSAAAGLLIKFGPGYTRERNFYIGNDMKASYPHQDLLPSQDQVIHLIYGDRFKSREFAEIEVPPPVNYIPPPPGGQTGIDVYFPPYLTDLRGVDSQHPLTSWLRTKAGDSQLYRTKKGLIIPAFRVEEHNPPGRLFLDSYTHITITPQAMSQASIVKVLANMEKIFYIPIADRSDMMQASSKNFFVVVSKPNQPLPPAAFALSKSVQYCVPVDRNKYLVIPHPEQSRAELFKLLRVEHNDEAHSENLSLAAIGNSPWVSFSDAKHSLILDQKLLRAVCKDSCSLHIEGFSYCQSSLWISNFLRLYAKQDYLTMADAAFLKPFSSRRTDKTRPLLVLRMRFNNASDYISCCSSLANLDEQTSGQYRILKQGVDQYKFHAAVIPDTDIEDQFPDDDVLDEETIASLASLGKERMSENSDPNDIASSQDEVTVLGVRKAPRSSPPVGLNSSPDYVTQDSLWKVFLNDFITKQGQNISDKDQKAVHKSLVTIYSALHPAYHSLSNLAKNADFRNLQHVIALCLTKSWIQNKKYKTLNVNELVAALGKLARSPTAAALKSLRNDLSSKVGVGLVSKATAPKASKPTASSEDSCELTKATPSDHAKRKTRSSSGSDEDAASKLADASISPDTSDGSTVTGTAASASSSSCSTSSEASASSEKSGLVASVSPLQTAVATTLSTSDKNANKKKQQKIGTLAASFARQQNKLTPSPSVSSVVTADALVIRNPESYSVEPLPNDEDFDDAFDGDTQMQ